MLIRKDLLNKLIELASDSAEYLNSGEHWITVHPHGKDSKGQPLLVKDGETSKEAVERKFGKSKDKAKTSNFIGKKYMYDLQGNYANVVDFDKNENLYMIQYDGDKKTYALSEKDLIDDITEAEKNEKNYKESEDLKKRKELEEQKRVNIDNFAKDKSKLEQGRIIKILNKPIQYKNKNMYYKDFIKLKLEEGYKPKYMNVGGHTQKYVLFNSENKTYRSLDKTMFDYAEYLLSK